MNYIISQILKQRRITEYLTKKGILPSGPERNGKLKYHCPIHQNDHTPSFYVYLNSKEFENFYCFGCKAKYHIIHLYRDLEKVSISDAVKALASDIDINIDSELTYVVDEINNDMSPWAVSSPVHYALQINKAMYFFLQQVEHDEVCLKSVEQMSEVVDEAVERGDMEQLRMITDTLPDILIARLKTFVVEKEKKERDILRALLHVDIN